jgi:broad specificity phosphatase PhoE
MANGLARGRRQVIFLRSGQTAWGADRRFVGNRDIDLDHQGVLAAHYAAKQLGFIRPTAIITSDLQRATKTAAPLEDRTGLSALKDSRLRPLNAPTLEGLTPLQISQRYPGELQTWEDGGSKAQPPGGGESRWEAGRRATECILEALTTGTQDAVLIVVTHDLTARAAICTMLDFLDSQWGTFEELSYCAWSTLDQGRRGWFIGKYNVQRLHPSNAPVEFAEDDAGEF